VAGEWLSFLSGALLLIDWGESEGPEEEEINKNKSFFVLNSACIIACNSFDYPGARY
jgi:hypothetical protein